MLEFLDQLAATERRIARYLPGPTVTPTSRQFDESGSAQVAALAQPTFIEFVRDRLRVNLSEAQRVLVTVAFDGVDPIDLPEADREIARQLFGDVDRFPPVTRAVLVAVCGARGGKSYILSALYSLYRALYADLSTMAPGEVAVALVVAPDLGLAHQTLNYAKGAVEASDELRPLVIADNADSLVLRRPDGQVVSILCRAAGRGGGGLRGKSLVSAVLDECAFFRDQSYVVNDRDVFKAVSPRVLPGGAVVIASTPWAEAGLLFDEFKLNYGHPVTAIAVTAPTLLMLPTQRNIDAVAREEQRDPDNAEREFGAQFMSVGSGTFFDRDSCVIDESAQPATNATRGVRVGVGGDLALVRDAAALVVVHEKDGHFTVAEVVEKKPARGAPLKLSEVTKDFAAVAKRHGANEIEVDQHEIEAAREHLPDDVSLVECVGGQQGKVDTYSKVRDLLHTKRIHIPPQYQRLANQLRDVIKKPTSGGGMRIYSPHKNNVHGDIVSAFVLAVDRVDLKATSIADDLAATNFTVSSFNNSRYQGFG
jgi:hypothetical protein